MRNESDYNELITKTPKKAKTSLYFHLLDCPRLSHITTTVQFSKQYIRFVLVSVFVLIPPQVCRQADSTAPCYLCIISTHQLTLCLLPVVIAAAVLWGGEMVSHSYAQEDSWRKMLAFLREHLHSGGNPAAALSSHL